MSILLSLDKAWELMLGSIRFITSNYITFPEYRQHQHLFIKNRYSKNS